VAEMYGTIPEIKQRPKVARRPTIPALPAQKSGGKAARKDNPATAASEEKQIVGEKPVQERAKSGMRSVIPFKTAKSSNEPVCAVAAPAVPAALEQTPAASLALPEVSDGPAPAAPAGSANSTVATVSKALAVSTIPPVRERPKVSRKSTITASKAVGSTVAAKKSRAKTEAAPVDKNETLVGSWISWAPLAVGIVLGFLSPQLHSLAAQWDPWGLRIVFPVVQVLGLREIGIGDELNRTLPQLMLYLQFPLEGLLVAMNMRRGMRISMAIGPIPALHFVCGLVLWIVALGSLKPL